MASHHATLVEQLARLLDLPHPPVAVTLVGPVADEPGDPAPAAEPIPAQPAGCCFWEPAQRRRLETRARDHAQCSVGSYTPGLIPLETAATGQDTAALVGSGWVSEADLHAAPRLPFTPEAIRYQPAADADQADVILVRLSPTALMTLQGAWPGLALVTKPQCQIIPLAHAGATAVSPGCAVSRVRTGMPEGELTCALPAHELPALVERLEHSVAADHAVSQFAAADRFRYEQLT
jgi:uncharacterized protein (DUF169 family)